jgi:hypothetical protein
MKKLIVLCVIGALIVLTGCKKSKGSEEIINELRDEVTSLKKVEKELQEKKFELTNRTAALDAKISDLEKAKDLSKIVFVGKPTFEFKDQNVYIRGTVKNEGSQYLQNISLKVAFTDERDNIYKRDFTVQLPELENRHLYFHEITGGLDPGKEKKFELAIYYERFDGGADNIRKAIAAWKKYGKQINIALLWGESVREFK